MHQQPEAAKLIKTKNKTVPTKSSPKPSSSHLDVSSAIEEVSPIDFAKQQKSSYYKSKQTDNEICNKDVTSIGYKGYHIYNNPNEFQHQNEMEKHEIESESSTDDSSEDSTYSNSSEESESLPSLSVGGVSPTPLLKEDKKVEGDDQSQSSKLDMSKSIVAQNAKKEYKSELSIQVSPKSAQQVCNAPKISEPTPSIKNSALKSFEDSNIGKVKSMELEYFHTSADQLPTKNIFTFPLPRSISKQSRSKSTVTLPKTERCVRFEEIPNVKNIVEFQPEKMHKQISSAEISKSMPSLNSPTEQKLMTSMTEIPSPSHVEYTNIQHSYTQSPLQTVSSAQMIPSQVHTEPYRVPSQSVQTPRNISHFFHGQAPVVPIISNGIAYIPVQMSSPPATTYFPPNTFPLFSPNSPKYLQGQGEKFNYSNYPSQYSFQTGHHPTNLSMSNPTKDVTSESSSTQLPTFGSLPTNYSNHYYSHPQPLIGPSDFIPTNFTSIQPTSSSSSRMTPKDHVIQQQSLPKYQFFKMAGSEAKSSNKYVPLKGSVASQLQHISSKETELSRDNSLIFIDKIESLPRSPDRSSKATLQTNDDRNKTITETSQDHTIYGKTYSKPLKLSATVSTLSQSPSVSRRTVSSENKDHQSNSAHEPTSVHPNPLPFAPNMFSPVHEQQYKSSYRSVYSYPPRSDLESNKNSQDRNAEVSYAISKRQVHKTPRPLSESFASIHFPESSARLEFLNRSLETLELNTTSTLQVEKEKMVSSFKNVDTEYSGKQSPTSPTLPPVNYSTLPTQVTSPSWMEIFEATPPLLERYGLQTTSFPFSKVGVLLILFT